MIKMLKNTKKNLKKAMASTLVIATAVTMMPTADLGTAFAVAENLDVAKTYDAYRAPSLVDANYDGQVDTTWSTFTFGEFPQTEVTEGDAEFKALSSDETLAWETVSNPYRTWLASVSNKKYTGSIGIVTYKGTKYLRMKAADCTYSTSATNQNVYYIWDSNYHYFKYEPIKWRVLNIDDPTNALVVSDTLIDCQTFNYTSDASKYKGNHASNNWKYSTLRSYLNGYKASANVMGADYSNYALNFTSAFSDEELSYINQTNYEYATNASSITDRFFCLSYTDVKSDNYGFGAPKETTLESRTAKVSDYAKCMGLFTWYDRAYWWTRTSSSVTGQSSVVDYMGDLHPKNFKVSTVNFGVRPAMYVNLSALCEKNAINFTGYVDQNRHVHKYRGRFIDQDGQVTYVLSDAQGAIGVPYGYESAKYSYKYYALNKDGDKVQIKLPKVMGGNMTIYSEKVEKTNPTETDSPESVVTVYYKRAANSSWPYAFAHYKVGNTWTVSPGKIMTKINDGLWAYSFSLNSSSKATICFNNGSNVWDTNNGKNYTVKGGTYLIDQLAGTVSEYNPKTTVAPTATVAPTEAPATTAPETTATAVPTATVAPTETPAANQVVVYYKRAINTSWTAANVHYNVNGSWTVAPGVAMTKVSAGYWSYTIDLGDASTTTLCFNNGANAWDNNGGKNYTLSAGSYVVDQTNDGKISPLN